jgi:diacylglycerol kinase
MAELLSSFRCAMRGVWLTLKNERNMRIHLVVMGYMLFFSVFYSLSRAEYAVLILTFALVIGGEIINTAIERVGDILDDRENMKIRMAKDVAAGAVLVFAVAAFLVGVCLFWDVSVFAVILERFSRSPSALAGLLLSGVASWFFIFKIKSDRGYQHAKYQ